jgi:hypothetical protein
MKAELTELFRYLKKNHDWFVRKSQHYILGNWFEYVKDRKIKWDYIRNFPRAYVRFMFFSLKDFQFQNREKK